MLVSRKHDKSGHGYVDPSVQLNTGLWTLFAGASLFLALRVWIKITRRHGLWCDDYILIACWVCDSFFGAYSLRPNMRIADQTEVPPCDQQQLDISRVCNRICNRHVGRSHAYTHHHYLLRHIDQPSSHQNRIRRNATQVNQELDAFRISMGTMVLHWLDESLHDCQDHRSVGQDLREKELRCVLSIGLLCGCEFPR